MQHNPSGTFDNMQNYANMPGGGQINNMSGNRQTYATGGSGNSGAYATGAPNESTQQYATGSYAMSQNTEAQW